MRTLYDRVSSFKQKNPLTIVWRMKKHVGVVELHINPDEEVLYAFAGQLNDVWYDIVSSCVVCLTNKRILIGQKKLFWGYKYISITPDLFNDLNLRARLIFGTAIIDTLQEKVYISNIDKRGLCEIETEISSYMIKEKKKYANKIKEG